MPGLRGLCAFEESRTTDSLRPVRSCRAQLPEAAAGEVAFVAMGFTYKSRFPVEEFAKRFRADFGKEPRATFFEVPMIGGMAVMGKWFIDSGMRRGTPKEDHEHVITVYNGAGE